ncbi:hypothetical protein FISHEDRAFT_41272 [Fistulina hepatica ATCC 64428]|nr:hypothetical protein FISHEDRAFT_41272 [Fistulina hepatica ATCC 64428]
MHTHPSQLTIVLLPVSLSLVHIPRHRLPEFFHPVLRQILQPESFLNITMNELEMCIYGEGHMLTDFELAARRDRRRRSRSGSGSSRHHADGQSHDEVEISMEKWSVLQIDSHNTSGARVNELSAPLAVAGISILYQSSYMSDFIFVKETRLQQVLHLFAELGFVLYAGDSSDLIISHPPSLTASPSIGRRQPNYDPNTPTRSSSLESKKPERQTSKSPSPVVGEVSILSPNLACVGLNDVEVENWSLKLVKLIAYPELIVRPDTPRSSRTSSLVTPVNEAIDLTASGFLRKSLAFDFPLPSPSEDAEDSGYHSPISSPSVLSPTRSLTDLPPPSSPTHCSADGRSPTHIATPIPPLSPIHPPPPFLRSSMRSLSQGRSPSESIMRHREIWPPPPPAVNRVPFFSYTHTCEGSSLTTDVALLAILFPPAERHMVICAGELDAADARHAIPGGDDTDYEDEDSDNGTLKCLQINLRRLGLGKLSFRHASCLAPPMPNSLYSSS